VLSTAHIDRVAAFSLLISMPKGQLTTAQIVKFLNKAKPTALKIMTEFKAIGLADMDDVIIEGVNPQTGISYKTHSKQITLKEEFKWFLEEEFDKLREGFVATDNRAYMNIDEDATEKEKQKQEASQEPRKENRAHILTIFWQVYDQLEKQAQQNPANHMSNDKDTVSHYELHKALLASGQFYQGDATQVISDMVKDGRLKVVAYDTYRRIKS
jgi:hypothetical protein